MATLRAFAATVCVLVAALFLLLTIGALAMIGTQPTWFIVACMLGCGSGAWSMAQAAIAVASATDADM